MNWIDLVVQDVAELDYNSPEGQPDVMLVKAGELRAILESRDPMAPDTTTMWAVHVEGPDDLYVCFDRETAEALTLVLNRQFERHTKQDDPPMTAKVVKWPYGYEAWKADSEQLRFEAVKA